MYWLGIGLSWAFRIGLQPFLVRLVRYLSGVCAAEADVDFLLIAKPVATNHLRIRRDCAIVLVTLAGCW